MKKKLLKLGILGSAILPLITIIACGTPNKNNDSEKVSKENADQLKQEQKEKDLEAINKFKNYLLNDWEDSHFNTNYKKIGTGDPVTDTALRHYTQRNRLASEDANVTRDDIFKRIFKIKPPEKFHEYENDFLLKPNKWEIKMNLKGLLTIGNNKMFFRTKTNYLPQNIPPEKIELKHDFNDGKKNGGVAGGTRKGLNIDPYKKQFDGTGNDKLSMYDIMYAKIKKLMNRITAENIEAKVNDFDSTILDISFDLKKGEASKHINYQAKYYLDSKSYEDYQNKLYLSEKLGPWIFKNHSPDFSGEDFALDHHIYIKSPLIVKRPNTTQYDWKFRSTCAGDNINNKSGLDNKNAILQAIRDSVGNQDIQWPSELNDPEIKITAVKYSDENAVLPHDKIDSITNIPFVNWRPYGSYILTIEKDTTSIPAILFIKGFKPYDNLIEEYQ